MISLWPRDQELLTQNTTPAKWLRQMPETDRVGDPGVSGMSALVLHLAVTFSQPRVMKAAGRGGRFLPRAAVTQPWPVATVRNADSWAKYSKPAREAQYLKFYVTSLHV